MKLALIDADIVAYRAAASAENEPEDIAILRADKIMREILEATQAPLYRGFISGQNNFRKIINPQYKANRKDVPRPIHLTACQEFLIGSWECEVTDGYEADDALGMAQTDQSVICSIDKDLLQVPGEHYSWEISGTSGGKQWVRPASFHYTSDLFGLRFFWKQMLIGDVADNIVGAHRVGPKGADKLIDPLEDPTEMFEAVLEKYNGDLPRLLLNGVCLYVWQQKEKLWPNLLLNQYRLKEAYVQEAEAMLKSMKSLTDVTLMEPTMTPQPISGSPVNGTSTEATPTESAVLT